MLGYPNNDAEQERLVRIIGIPASESASFAHANLSEVYARSMAKAIVDAEADPGGFFRVLQLLVDCRMHVALLMQDDPVVHALADFGFNRAAGRMPRRESFTSIQKGQSLESLRKKIESNIFSCPEKRGFIRTNQDGDREYREEFEAVGAGFAWAYRIARKGHSDTINIYHASNRDVPDILAYLDSLWDVVLGAQAWSGRSRALAEFEWWFIAANVTARSGAGIGDSLSLVLQRRVGIPIRREFQHVDWEVLSRPLHEYVAWRVAQIQEGTL